MKDCDALMLHNHNMAVDVLIPCVARASAALVLIWFAWNILVSAQEELNTEDN